MGIPPIIAGVAAPDGSEGRKSNLYWTVPFLILIYWGLYNMIFVFDLDGSEAQADCRPCAIPIGMSLAAATTVLGEENTLVRIVNPTPKSGRIHAILYYRQDGEFGSSDDRNGAHHFFIDFDGMVRSADATLMSRCKLGCKDLQR